MKHLISLMICLCFFFTACTNNQYVSKYKATLMNTSHTTNTCSMSFKSFEGTYVFKVRVNNDTDVSIQYIASLEIGTINVYYHVDINDTKDSMFTINSNESLNDSTGYIEKGQLVYIIIESDGQCKNGTFSFNLN